MELVTHLQNKQNHNKYEGIHLSYTFTHHAPPIYS